MEELLGDKIARVIKSCLDNKEDKARKAAKEKELAENIEADNLQKRLESNLADEKWVENNLYDYGKSLLVLKAESFQTLSNGKVILLGGVAEFYRRLEKQLVHTQSLKIVPAGTKYVNLYLEL